MLRPTSGYALRIGLLPMSSWVTASGSTVATTGSSFVGACTKLNLRDREAEQSGRPFAGVGVGVAELVSLDQQVASEFLIRWRGVRVVELLGATPIKRCRERDETHEGHRGHPAPRRSSLRDDACPGTCRLNRR